MKTEKIITKEKLVRWLVNGTHTKSPLKVMEWVIFHINSLQEPAEQQRKETAFDNGVGWTQGDARVGTLTAEAIAKYGAMQEWQLKMWASLNSKGEPRLAKYHKQLNDIAINKRKQESLSKYIMQYAAKSTYQQ